LYASNVSSWSHSQAGVRRALSDAADAGLTVKNTPKTHGHSWGYIDCADPDCTLPVRRYYVDSTPKNENDEANKIRRFVRKHEHKKENL
jgi:hypothetical protein